MDVEHSFSPQDALVAVMVATSAADENLSTPELLVITRIIDTLPVFAGYDGDRLKTVSQSVFDLFEVEDGIEALLGLVREALPEGFNETAYALACDVAAADGNVKMSELEFLQILRHDLGVGRLAGAAIERGARARFQRLPAE
ncbi:tellurite resistance TerB family protein [Oceanicella sp. SM1341]|uniref:tellurite resistance TerB family protein n=1 Tax=Oceanicella sp. SM1341 TaxID=1548889 RepID=UPI000E46967D|nr:tellurite resistance TerB family protein [Oceanicella sp. SM1341]